jgi:Fe-Mn family superoxide dismutase
MNPESPSGYFSRRDVLKAFGAAAAFLGLRSLATPASAADAPAPVPPSPTLQPFVLPKLAYAYDALEPHIDARTMEIHYTKHHQAYIANANKALADHPELQSLTGEAILADLGAIPESIRTTLRNNVGGHVNHSFFWRIIGPGGGGAPSGPLADAINAKFGSFEKFQAAFTEAAMKRFGSGWAWLTAKQGSLEIASTANQDSPLSDGATPVLGIDVWEHAYYLKQQNRRADYVKAYWEVVNWPQAAANFSAAS